MSESTLLTEVERQEKCLAELPKDFDFPAFNGKQAVESQRKSGYRSTARAAREIIDNAIEAGAKHVHVVFERAGERNSGMEKNERRNAVCGIAFIDDGSGMLPDMARYALSWGGGTHFKDPSMIGKFGFGLPNSSINQTRRVEVYSRVAADGPWARTYLDINEIPPHGLVTIPPAEEIKKLPKFVDAYITKRKVPIGAGTIVVWSNPDRLTYRTAAQLKEHLLDDFGVVYRDLLGRFEVQVDGDRVEATDPLFLTPDARLYVPEEQGGAQCTFEQEIPVKYYRDPETGSQHLERLQSMDELSGARTDEKVEAVGVLKIKIARFPYGFALDDRHSKQDQLTDPQRRFEIRKSRRGMCFVRSGREIETVDAFPRSRRDVAAGLGHWPLLQSYAYHWGVVVYFSPALDEAFGIGNDKQTVRPIEDFWRVLVGEKIDDKLNFENAHQKTVRSKERQKRAEERAKSGETPASAAAAKAKTAMGRDTPLPPSRRNEAKERAAEEIDRRAKELGGPKPKPEHFAEAEQAIQREAQRTLYAVDFFDAEGGVFYKPGYGNGYQRVALINRKHPFFELFYSHVANLPDQAARNALDVLLFALADAELNAEDGLRDMYEHQREAVWTPFLKSALKIMERMERSDTEEEDDDAVSEPAASAA